MSFTGDDHQDQVGRSSDRLGQHVTFLLTPDRKLLLLMMMMKQPGQPDIGQTHRAAVEELDLGRVWLPGPTWIHGDLRL